MCLPWLLILIVGVIDGDSLQAQGGTQLRLWQVDAPEWNQIGGLEATRAVERALGPLPAKAWVRICGKDNYGRDLVWVKPAAWKAWSLNAWMVWKGYAQPYPRTAGGFIFSVYLARGPGIEIGLLLAGIVLIKVTYETVIK